MLIFWIIFIAIISVIWAFIALKKEHGKKELNEASKNISQGRVVYHSSDSSGSSSS